MPTMLGADADIGCTLAVPWLYLVVAVIVAPCREERWRGVPIPNYR